ncbi:MULTISPECIES: hypothetical protein [unclassified Ensifer]|uniref:hypothetical protein n=1 Tax=unclassified Ensifer TaxID=2633371 RepID=UPI0008139594|nr:MULTISPECIES: hypothetical protein [unclassified Ensifer]OCP01324.1 hypothetical protein BC362_23110 [Ensifer sp. LC14]OCP03216.1 hypothetical protein BBX50_06235 [Ensifer sp. LC11]OCP03586.1 hypothetical protein BC374_06290 [Ensifer sp. LC13]OCP33999.1 hypothetical protein BC364_13780 [Ensifer sp. LC499]
MRARSSSIRRDQIEYGFWLVFGDDGSMRFSRSEPKTGRGERAMKCGATLPIALFRTPELRATIAISEGIPASYEINVEAAGEALRHALGVDIDLQVKGAGHD